MLHRRFPLSPREEFDALFQELTGIPVADAQVGEDGFLFIPPETNLEKKDRLKRSRISELANEEWRNNIVDDNYAGWWIKPPA